MNICTSFADFSIYIFQERIYTHRKYPYPWNVFIYLYIFMRMIRLYIVLPSLVCDFVGMASFVGENNFSQYEPLYSFNWFYTVKQVATLRCFNDATIIWISKKLNVLYLPFSFALNAVHSRVKQNSNLFCSNISFSLFFPLFLFSSFIVFRRFSESKHYVSSWMLEPKRATSICICVSYVVSPPCTRPTTDKLIKIHRSQRIKRDECRRSKRTIC